MVHNTHTRARKAKHQSSTPIDNDAFPPLTVPRSGLLVQARLVEQRETPEVRGTIRQDLTGRRHLHVHEGQALLQQTQRLPRQQTRLVTGRPDHTLATVSSPASTREEPTDTQTLSTPLLFPPSLPIHRLPTHLSNLIRLSKRFRFVSKSGCSHAL